MPGKMLDVIGGQSQSVERFCQGFPRTAWGQDIGIKLAGAGGDGAQTAALLITRAAINEGFDSTHIPSYGPESRGGTSYADVRIAEDEVLSPAAPEPHVLVAFNAPSVAKFGPHVPEGGVVVYDSSVVAGLPALRPGVKAVGVPFTQIAADLGKIIVKNIVALGALSGSDAPLPQGDVPDRRPPGPRREVRAHPAQRGGVRLGGEEGGRGGEGGRVSGEALLPLSPEETKLLLALREMPPSRLRDLMTTLVAELAEFVAEPTLLRDAGRRRPVPDHRHVVRRVPEGHHHPRGAARPAAGGLSAPSPEKIEAVPAEADAWTSESRRRRGCGSTAWPSPRPACGPSSRRGTGCGSSRRPVSRPATPTRTTRRREHRSRTAATRSSPGRGSSRPSIAPSPQEYEQLQKEQVVFGFWALPAMRPEDFRALTEREATTIGIEAIEDDAGHAPVRTSMSEIAGSLAVVLGSGLLLNEFGGKGILLGGVPGVPSASFVVLGAGVLGRAAARAALGLGAQVTLLDVSVAHLREAASHLPATVTTMLATPPNVEKALSFADLVLGAVAVREQRAPVLVTREMLRLMKPRTVVVDLAIDMGGCFETSRPTTFTSPTYEVDGIIHMCIPNLPSGAARTATLALTNATLPYLQAVADHGIDAALRAHPDLARGTYLYRGRCASETLARAFGVEWRRLPGVEE